MSIFIKTSECLANFIFYFIIVEVSANIIYYLESNGMSGIYLLTVLKYLVINQTNSLKLISPFPSWSISQMSSWFFFISFFVFFPLCHLKFWFCGSPTKCSHHLKKYLNIHEKFSSVWVTWPSSRDEMNPPPSLWIILSYDHLNNLKSSNLSKNENISLNSSSFSSDKFSVAALISSSRAFCSSIWDERWKNVSRIQINSYWFTLLKSGLWHDCWCCTWLRLTDQDPLLSASSTLVHISHVTILH